MDSTKPQLHSEIALGRVDCLGAMLDWLTWWQCRHLRVDLVLLLDFVADVYWDVRWASF
jgi:hypothetical protein